MLSIILTQPEASKIHGVNVFKLRRKVGERLYIPPGGVLTPEHKAALLMVSTYQIGRQFYTQEHFKHTYDEAKNETWIQYMADARMHPACPMKARLEYGPNGVYTGKLQHEALARCRLEVIDIDLAFNSVVTPTGRVTDMKQWEWVITFKKVEIVPDESKGTKPVREAPASSTSDREGAEQG